MLKIPYDDIIHTKTLMDEYNLVDKNKSIIRSIILKYYRFTINGFIKKLNKRKTDDISIDKGDIIAFCKFLNCIENNNRKDKVCIVRSPYIYPESNGNRFNLLTDDLVIDTGSYTDSTMEVIKGNITYSDIYRIYGTWGEKIYNAMVTTISNYLLK